MSTSIITIKVNESEKERFKLLSILENKTTSQLVKDLIEQELKSKKITARDLRKLSPEMRSNFLKQMTKVSLPIYQKYKNELEIEETGDGIE
jgi:hypothetical protein